MVRSELLRAKSLHAEVAYLRDLQRVGDAKRLEQEQSSMLRDKERRFWAEAIKGRPANAAQPLSTPSHVQTTAQLERMHQAHSQLRAARRTHEHATQKLNEGLATLSTSQKRIEILEKLLAKAQRIKANKVESRLSEEVAELVTTSRSVMKVRATLSGETEPRDGAALTDVARETVALTKPQQPQVQAPAQLGITVQAPVLPALAATATSRVAIPSTLGPVGGAGISDVSFSQVRNEPTLSLKCNLGSQGVVGLRVTKAESGGGLKVLIDPSAIGVASGVLREKGAIQARLQAMGIKVSTIELGASENDPSMTRGAKRSRLHAEEDEDDIS